MCLGVLLVIVLYKAAAMAGASNLNMHIQPFPKKGSQCLVASLELYTELIARLMLCTDLQQIHQRVHASTLHLRSMMKHAACIGSMKTNDG